MYDLNSCSMVDDQSSYMNNGFCLDNANSCAEYQTANDCMLTDYGSQFVNENNYGNGLGCGPYF